MCKTEASKRQSIQTPSSFTSTTNIYRWKNISKVAIFPTIFMPHICQYPALPHDQDLLPVPAHPGVDEGERAANPGSSRLPPSRLWLPITPGSVVSHLLSLPPVSLSPLSLLFPPRPFLPIFRSSCFRGCLRQHSAPHLTNSPRSCVLLYPANQELFRSGRIFVAIKLVLVDKYEALAFGLLGNPG